MNHAKQELRWPYEAEEQDGPTTADIQDLPLACSLPAADKRQRRAVLKTEFIPRVIETEEITDGFVYWFERTDEDMRQVAEFALFESRCCNFLSFGIGLHPDGTRISLRISGPKNGPEFLKQAMIGSVPAAVSECDCPDV